MKDEEKDGFLSFQQELRRQEVEQAERWEGVRSKYCEEYENFFRNAPKPDLPYYLQRLKQNGIEYDPSKKQKEYMLIKEVTASYNYETVLMQIYFGPFTLTLNLLNKKQRSVLHYCDKIGKGAAGHIYSFSFEGQEYVGKCVECANYSSKKSPLIIIIQEYCFFKICSVLEVGPKISNHSQFDLICYSDCIQFTMEKCVSNLVASQNAQETLKASLLLLHSFQIIHFDIKPQNISFSPCYKKCIFLDFGFSKFINQPQGYMKDLFFIGTIGYCSQQMNNAYFGDGKGLVDPYYNDVVGLQRSLFYFKKMDVSMREEIRGNAESYFHHASSESQSDAENGSVVLNKAKSSPNPQAVVHSNIQKLVHRQLCYQSLIYSISFLERYKFLKTEVMDILCTHSKKLTQFLLNSYPSSAVKQFYKAYIEGNIQFDSFELSQHLYKNPLIDSQQPTLSYRSRVSNIFNFDINLVSNNTNRAYVDQQQIFGKLTKGQSDFVTVQEYYSSFIEFISFNRIDHNNSINDKITVCSIFLQQTTNHNITNIEAIHKALFFLIDYSLTVPTSLFKEFIFSQSYEQASILNILKDEDILQYIKRIQAESFSIQQKINFFMIIDRSLEWSTNRLICVNDVYRMLIKKELCRSTQRIIMQRINVNKFPYQLKLIANNYIHEQYLISDYNKIISSFNKFFKEVLAVNLTSIQQKTIKINIISKILLNDIKQHKRTSVSLFKLFQQLLFQKNQHQFKSYHLILSLHYNNMNNQPDYERLIAPLRISLGEEFNHFNFQLRSLKMKAERSHHDYQEYVTYLIFLADKFEEKKMVIHEKVMTEMIAMRIHCIRKNMIKEHSETYEKLCKKIKEHSDRYQAKMVQQYSQKAKTFSRIKPSNARYYFFNIIYDFDKPRLQNLLDKILGQLQNYKDQKVYYFQILLVRHAKNVLKDVIIMLQKQTKQHDKAENMLLRYLQVGITNEDHLLRIECYNELISLFLNQPEKRQIYCFALHQYLSSYDFSHYYFSNSNQFIYYILDAIQKQTQCDSTVQLSTFILKISHYVYVYYSTHNFIVYLVSMRTFIEKNVKTFNQETIRILFMGFCQRLRQHPYLGVVIALLLPVLPKNIKREALVKIAGTMNKLSVIAKRSIFKTYMLEMSQLFASGGRCKHIQLQYYKRYNLTKVEKIIEKKRIDVKMKSVLKVKIRKFYNKMNGHEQ